MNAPQPQYVEIRKNRAGQDRAYIIGRRVRVQDIVQDHERFGQSAGEIARSLELSNAQVHGALAYFFEDRETIWKYINEDEAFAEKMRQEQEAAQITTHSSQTDASSPSVSS